MSIDTYVVNFSHSLISHVCFIGIKEYFISSPNPTHHSSL